MTTTRKSNTPTLITALITAGALLTTPSTYAASKAQAAIPVRITGYIQPKPPEPCTPMELGEQGTNVLYTTTCPADGQTPPDKFALNDDEPRHFSDVRIPVDVTGKDGTVRTEHLALSRDITTVYRDNQEHYTATYYVEWPEDAIMVRSKPDHILYQFVE